MRSGSETHEQLLGEAGEPAPVGMRRRVERLQDVERVEVSGAHEVVAHALIE